MAVGALIDVAAARGDATFHGGAVGAFVGAVAATITLPRAGVRR